MPADDVVQERRVEHRAADRADLVEGGRERDRAVAADRAVGRLHADRAGDGGGLADRAAGVAAEGERAPRTRRPRRRSHRRSRRGCGRGPTGCGSGRTRSTRSTSPSRTRPCWSCRAARGRRRGAWRRRSRRTAAPSPRGSCEPEVEGMSVRAQHVLDGDRDAGERAELLARGTACVDRRRRRRGRRPMTWRNACTSPSTAAMRSRWAWVASTLETSPRRELARASVGCGEADQIVAHCSSPRIARHPEAAVVVVGRAGERLLLRQRLADHVGAEHVHERDRVARRRDVGVATCCTFATLSTMGSSSA